MLKYIQSLENIAEDMIKSGKSVEQASSVQIPEPFDAWLCLEDFFTVNLKFLYNLAQKRSARGKRVKRDLIEQITVA